MVTTFGDNDNTSKDDNKREEYESLTIVNLIATRENLNLAEFRHPKDSPSLVGHMENWFLCRLPVFRLLLINNFCAPCWQIDDITTYTFERQL